MFGKKTATAVPMAVLRDLIREEIKTELHHLLPPTFIELVTRGHREMELIFDGVRIFQDELDGVKLSVRIIEARLAQLDA
jgi:hypothetical protein